MKQTVNWYDFRRAFETHRSDNFSYEGLEALLHYLKELEESIGEDMELDVIAICCDYTEYTLGEFNSDWGQDFDDIESAIDYLHNQNTEAFVVNENSLILGQ